MGSIEYEQFPGATLWVTAITDIQKNINTFKYQLNDIFTDDKQACEVTGLFRCEQGHESGTLSYSHLSQPVYFQRRNKKRF